MGTIETRITGAAPDAAKRDARHWQASWLQGLGAGALGLIIGFGVGVAGVPSSLSPLPLMERAGLDRAPAGHSLPSRIEPGVAGGQAAVRPLSGDRAPAALPSVATSLASAPGLAGTAPLPGGMEPCWSVREMVDC